MKTKTLSKENKAEKPIMFHSIIGPRMGEIAGITHDSGVLVDFLENPAGEPLPAAVRSGIGLDDLRSAFENRSSVILLFKNNRPDRPVIYDLTYSPAEEESLKIRRATAASAGEDEKLLLESDREIRFQCGRSSLSLKADGSVTIRGTRVESRASKTNKIKGANVKVN